MRLWYGMPVSLAKALKYATELSSLHGDPEFEAIVEEIERRNEERAEPASNGD